MLNVAPAAFRHLSCLFIVCLRSPLFHEGKALLSIDFLFSRISCGILKGFGRC